ncbi:MAG TPA: hypothetical protein VFS97_11860 [Nitrososphaeraceae archaeon]|nr:hypothetical protein [Nitrososphaeraceae archaeon]
MTEAHSNNSEDYSTEAIHNKSKRSSQNKVLLKAVEALEYQCFGFSDGREN